MALHVAPVDPNVRLPAAVVAATQRAQQLQDEMRQQREGETPPAPVAATPAPAPAPAPSPAPAPAPSPEAELEHKLKSTEGRLARAERERQSLAQRLAALERAAPPPASPSPTPAEDIEVSPLVTPEEVEEYGENFLEVVGRKAREELAGELFKVQRQINDLNRSVGGVTQAVVGNARDKMKAELDTALPDWRTINYDERFLSWLGLQDPFSGVIRHDLLKSAYAGNNTQRVLNFFKAFVAEEAAGSPPSPGTAATPAPAPNGNGAATPAKIPLESLAAPGRASPAAPPVPADKPIITTRQITQFYADVAAGRYRGRDAERLENDAAIILAANEGRIV